MYVARLLCACAASSRLFSRFCGLLVCLLILSAVCGATNTGPAAQFSGTVATLGGGFTTPSSVAVDPSGNVYVVDSASSSSAVAEIPLGCLSSGCVKTVGGTFDEPTGVAADSSGNVYIVNFTGTQVTEIPAGCTSSGCETTLGGGFQNPAGVAVDSNGNVYVADAGNLAVKEMAASCTSSSCVNTLGGGTNQPGGVAVDASGNAYYVSTSPSPAVYEIPLNCGTFGCEKQLGSGLNQPAGLSVDADGNLYVSDSANSALLEISRACIKGTNDSSCMTSLGSFSSPTGVAVDGNGNPYVADNGNNAVKEIMLNGVNFFSSNVQTAAASQTLMFTFTAGGSIAAPVVVTQGATGLDFTDAGTGTCTTNGTSHTYSAGDTCTVVIGFKPGRPGVRYGAVELTTSAGAMVATGYMYGVGEGPQAIFSSSTSQGTIGNGFDYPAAVAVDGSGNVFVADPFNGGAGLVKELTAASGYTSGKKLGTGFDEPVGVAVDGAGNVYVADTDNNAVWEMTPNCVSSDCMTQLGGGFNTPRAVAVDGGGDVLVADYGNNEVKKIPAGCTNDDYVSGTCKVATLGGGFLFPQGVAVDGSGNVFVGDSGNGLVKEIPPGCASSTCVQTLAQDFSFSGPTGVAVDGVGDVFVADAGTTSAVEEILVGGYTTVNSLGVDFNGPSGVAVDGAGNVFVGDSNNGLVEELNLANPPSLSFAATPAGQTSYDSPRTVTVGNDGNQKLMFSSVAYPADFPEGSGVETDCTSSSNVAAGASCTLTIDFSPLVSSTGNLNELVTLTDNSLNTSPSATQSIALSSAVFTAPSITSPTPSSTISSSNVTFQWDPGSGSSIFRLLVGTTGPGSDDVYRGTTSGTVANVNVPNTGGTLYVRLYYFSNGNWKGVNYTYMEGGTPTPPSMTSPTPSSTLGGASVTFQWDPGTGSTTFRLLAGTTGPGSSNLSLSTTSGTSATVSNIPTTGATVYVRLYYFANRVWKAVNYTYTEYGSPTPPSITSPAPGTTLTSSSVTFQWDPGVGSTTFRLLVGTTGPGSSDVYLGTTSGTSATVTVPTGGATLYVRLYYFSNRNWKGVNYTYTEP
ncbi:MAG TPA: hypothetical protein VHX13_04295 [Acidobacteriaceae bacterium]|jgi:DNA-binding beta-propeller fold protein YncE|nr:hypothetical protein [Acidobacteriaceae bacterium]